MPLEPELEAIFNQDPRFKEVLAQYEQNGTSDPRGDQFKVDNVTDEALQAYLDRFYPPLNPQFRSGEGSHVPPAGGMEDQLGDGQTEQTTPPPASGPTPGTPGSAPEGTPSTPSGDDTGGDPFRTDTPVDPRRLAAFQEFDRHLQSDPRLQQILYQYSTTGRIDPSLLEPPQSRYPRESASGPAVEHPESSAGPGPFVPPQPPPNIDLDDPAIRTLWENHVATQRTVHEQREQFRRDMEEIRQEVGETAEQFRSRVAAENDGLVTRVRNSFAHEHGLTPEEAIRIQRVAENMNVAATYMQGMDPITLMPVRPDPMLAAQRAFEVAYSVDPITQERERQRMQAAETLRQQQDRQRRQRLAGVGGGSGSAPRAPAEPTDEAGRRQAMIDFLRGHMEGSPEQ